VPVEIIELMRRPILEWVVGDEPVLDVVLLPLITCVGPGDSSTRATTLVA
jgi:hypothetical protein